MLPNLGRLLFMVILLAGSILYGSLGAVALVTTIMGGGSPMPWPIALVALGVGFLAWRRAMFLRRAVVMRTSA